MPGQLFTQYFLTDGIRHTPEWRGSVNQPHAFTAFAGAAAERFKVFSRYDNPNESVTEQELIRPVLALFGWVHTLPQQGAARNEDIPDHLLFADAASKDRAAGRSNSEARYRDALLIEESKRFGLPLDTRDATDKARSGTPHGQIRRYLSTADSVTDGRLRWGILTNGGVWRLYDNRARPRASGYYEADLGAILRAGNEDALRMVYLLFRRDAFTRRDGAQTPFLDAALAEGRRYEEQVARDLSNVVFDAVFPGLVSALARPPHPDPLPPGEREKNSRPSQTERGGETPQPTYSLPEIRDAALIFLYRLLFVLYAEDRGLLPVNDPRYDDYGLRKRVRDDIARRMQDGDTFSTHAASYYNHLITLFTLIDKGDASIGLPPYNGGLFASAAAPLLETARLPDAAVAPIVYAMSHREAHFVNYRDMSVQQLGSIYERLLEREPVRGADGNVSIRPNAYARKDSGSFYTPQELVDLIVDRTLKPLAEERLKAFEDKAAALQDDHRPKPERYADLRKFDPAEAVLDLKVLDPAMGSGHFLVTAVDFLSDTIAELIETVPAVPAWLDGGYASPLVERIERIRHDILQRAAASNWIIDEAQLTDQAIIRRMVLKRCIYGVDKNRLTVELAKVSLWLHSFTVGAPLSFLDHHLRVGDSLIGVRVQDATAELHRLGGLFAGSAIAGAEAATAGMQRIEAMSDADVAEVRESASLFARVEETTADLRGLLDFFCGWRWNTASMKAREKDRAEGQLVAALRDDAYSLLARGPQHADRPPPADAEAWRQFTELWRDARAIADREDFLHWEVAFPGVWRQWQNARPEGGFDAVIGNPPWDRIKLQEVEWFATRAPELALAPTAAARRQGIQRLRDAGDPLAGAFDDAKARADSLGQLVRVSGDYPLLGGGDINLYSLFVERAMHLVRPDGLVGLLTPSGIYADKTAADFFKSVSAGGRLGGLFDFENRKIFFKDIHASFKFCALIVGGDTRRFDETRCAFFLHDTAEIDDPDRCFPLAPSDFTRVNPNTGTAPVFRTRRDADITRRIYERHPVLVDRSGGGERKAWPVKYVTMFHMTNDSHRFRTAAQLDVAGFYPVQGNRWKRGEELYLPLYEGKMVQAFDHRAASVVVNPENLNRPAQPREASGEEHADPDWLPAPQFWVSIDDAEWPAGLGWTVAFKHVTAATNVRTMIACIAPRGGFGNSLPILSFFGGTSDEIQAYKENSHLVAANLNAIALDFVMRQKVQGQNLNWFIVEQLPVIAPADYDRPFGKLRTGSFGAMTARALVRDHVLRLTYTAHDMAPFARGLGYDGPPFPWNDEDRRHLRARLDALYFHLYGLSRDDAGYVLDTFPIVRREDEKQFGHYRTRAMVLAYMNALAAGDAETRVAV